MRVFRWRMFSGGKTFICFPSRLDCEAIRVAELVRSPAAAMEAWRQFPPVRHFQIGIFNLIPLSSKGHAPGSVALVFAPIWEHLRPGGTLPQSE
jgi:hypothetical protein